MKRLDDRDPVVAIVLGNEVEVGHDQCSHVVAVGDVDGRAVVDGADAHQEEVPRRLRRLLRQALDQVGMEVAERRNPLPPVAMRSKSRVRFR